MTAAFLPSRESPAAGSRRVRLGLALGSGAARGIAHVGVLKAFHEAGLQVDAIAGTSSGALVGAIYTGAGMDALLDAARTVSLWRLARPTLSMRGLASSAVVEELVTRYLGQKTFADLDRPFTAIATDLRTGREVLLNTGPVAIAVRASAGFVGLFAPVEIRGMYLVDGGVTCAVPVGVARGMGADVVVAVDVMPNVVIEDFPENVFGIVTRTLDILIRKAEEQQLAEADHVIQPIKGDVGSFDLAEADLLVALGEQAAAPLVAELKQQALLATQAGQG